MKIGKTKRVIRNVPKPIPVSIPRPQPIPVVIPQSIPIPVRPLSPAK